MMGSCHIEADYRRRALLYPGQKERVPENYQGKGTKRESRNKGTTIAGGEKPGGGKVDERETS